MCQKFGKRFPNTRQARRALPNNQYPPAKLQKSLVGTAVALNVASEFDFPELSTRLRYFGVTTAKVSVPETTVDKHDNPSSGKHNVRSSRQIPAVKPEPEACRKQGLANDDLRLRIQPPDSGHHPASRRMIDDINHCQPLGTSGMSTDGRENGRANIISLHSGRLAHSEIILPFAVSCRRSFTSRAHISTCSRN